MFFQFSYRGVTAKKVYVYVCKEALRPFSLSTLDMYHITL